ncbi:MAG TPA: glutathione S-transferase family protein [Kofleriaceae bacterium]|nr:glutathione S-transferase family protein [Kofleriaceae bacterium]
MLKLYGFARVNKVARGHTRDLRVLWALEEIGLPYEIVGMDHPNHDLDAPTYRALNPFGQIPVIDDDGVVVSESGAILLYLARKTGKLMPRDLAGEAQVLRWAFTALTTIEVPVLSLWFVNLTGGTGSPPSAALHDWAEMRLRQLDGYLADRQFIATDAFTVADILLCHVLDAGTRPEMIAPYPHLLAYRARCTERPAWQKTFAAYCERVEAA